MEQQAHLQLSPDLQAQLERKAMLVQPVLQGQTETLDLLDLKAFKAFKAYKATLDRQGLQALNLL